MIVQSRLAGLLRRIGIGRSRADEPPPPRYPDSHVIGWVDGVSDGHISGWAFSTLSPRRRVSVVAKVDGAPVARTLADLYRADVDRAYEQSDGYCGFSLSVARLPQRPVRLEAADFAIELSGAAIDLSRSSGRDAAPAGPKDAGRS
ncbi:MAG TPA: hypothetical protein PKA55_09255 [Rhodoblastus sp.]|nr:hypothetical protein [Rhodoblastus sp.]